jgi:F-type H+-transporting ATPase subunit b
MTILLAFAESIQLVPDGTIFLHIAIIIAMVFLLNRTLFKPINTILVERERRTKGSSTEAQGILRGVEENLSNYERSLKEARAESYRLLEEERAKAISERQSVMRSVREEVDQIIDNEEKLIEAQTSEARNTLEGDARNIAVSIKNQVLGRKASLDKSS